MKTLEQNSDSRQHGQKRNAKSVCAVEGPVRTNHLHRIGDEISANTSDEETEREVAKPARRATHIAKGRVFQVVEDVRALERSRGTSSGARSLHRHQLTKGCSQQEIFVDRAIVRKRRSSRRECDDLIDGRLVGKDPIHLLFRGRRWPPFHHVGHRAGEHPCHQFRRGPNGNGTFTRQEMPAPPFDAAKHANVRKGTFDRPRYRGLRGMVSLGQSLLQDSTRLQSLPGNGVELLRIEQARTCRLHRRRRVHNDGVVFGGRTFEEAPAIVDDHMRERRRH